MFGHWPGGSVSEYLTISQMMFLCIKDVEKLTSPMDFFSKGPLKGGGKSQYDFMMCFLCSEIMLQF